jgi:hypothetical protein
MNTNFRNAELLQKLERHPLKKALARALDASELFAGDIEHIKLDRRLSAEGRDDARRSKLRGALRDNRDARAPLAQMQATLEVKRAAVKRPPLDRSDKVAVDDRRQLRTILRGMDRGARALLLSGAGADPDFVDAMLEAKPIVSGLMPEEQFLVDAAREERLAGLYGPQLAEISELETTIAEANGIFDLALVDLKLHSEMDDRAFTEFTAPIMNRKNAPWLVKNGDAIIRVRPEMKGTPQLNQPATLEEIADGKYYKSETEYLADRAAA